MLKTKVIAKNVTNLTDARYFAAQGVDYILFDTSDISLEQMIEIGNWIEGVELILLLKEQDQDELFELIEKLQPAAIGSKSSELLSLILLHFPDQNIFAYSDQRKFLHESAFAIAPSANFLSKILSTFDQLPIFLDTTGLEPKHVANLVEQNPNIGIVLNGSDEEKVGVKEFDTLDEYFELLEL